jgi:electron transport complex protein RnfG
MIVSLTVVAVLSAAILGGIFLWTEPIRLKNQAEREAKTLRSLLSLPDAASMEEVRRYQAADLSVLYLTKKNLIHLSQEGKELERQASNLSSAEEYDQWVKSRYSVLQPKPVGRFFVARENEKILGYVIEGETQGYKSMIRFFAALNADFQLQGLEVLEQEEDPGLGAEISQAYFKNQFAGRSAEALRSLEVTKDPLDDEWKKALEELSSTAFTPWLEKYGSKVSAHPVIHAITGATISSDSLTQGVKRAVRHFQMRLELMKGAL